MGLASHLPYLELDHVTLKYSIKNTSGLSLKRDLFKFCVGGQVSTKFNGKNGIITALDGVSLSVKKGECLHVVGHNGAGKSTLLRIMAGIYSPTVGRVLRQGNVMTLLGLSGGALMKCTGIENIYRILMLNGVSKNECTRLVPYIMDFSELGDFIHMPIHTYSTGMLVRLMFSIATCREPEILIIDELIGAGDAAFHTKSQERISELIRHSSITVLATHSEDFAAQVCNRRIVLQKGKVIDDT